MRMYVLYYSLLTLGSVIFPDSKVNGNSQIGQLYFPPPLLPPLLMQLFLNMSRLRIFHQELLEILDLFPVVPLSPIPGPH